MLIAEYIHKYTSRRRIHFTHVLSEAKELLLEIIKFDKKGIKEEFQDMMHMLQLWFYWRMKINGRIWDVTLSSVNKFIKRSEVWKKIYKHAGLSGNVSGYCGNYNKLEKVINHLGLFDITKEKAETIYNKVVLGK